MLNTIFVLASFALIAGCSASFYIAWSRNDRALDAQRALNVLSSAPKDVELQLRKLAALVAARGISAHSASRSLGRAWGIPEKEASKLLQDALAV